MVLNDFNSQIKIFSHSKANITLANVAMCTKKSVKFKHTTNLTTVVVQTSCKKCSEHTRVWLVFSEVGHLKGL